MLSSFENVKSLALTTKKKNSSVLNKLSIRFREPDLKNMIVVYKARSSVELAYEPILSNIHSRMEEAEDMSQEELLIDIERRRSFEGKLSEVKPNESSANDPSINISSLPLEPSHINAQDLSTQSHFDTPKKRTNHMFLSPDITKSKLQSPNLRNFRSTSRTQNPPDTICFAKKKPLKLKLP